VLGRNFRKKYTVYRPPLDLRINTPNRDDRETGKLCSAARENIDRENNMNIIVQHQNKELLSKVNVISLASFGYFITNNG
jgi:hypothetical protein